jgi:excisionase family DNA binding protein
MKDNKLRETETLASCFEKLLGQEHTAELLGIHPETLRRMTIRGEIPALRVGRFWKYRASSLEAWVRSRLK